MTEKCRHEHPLQNNGQTQTQRLPQALDPAFFRVDERSVEDLLAFAWNYAASLEYFSADNQITGNWQGFLEHTRGKTLAELEAMPGQEPHFALFLCFLRLFGQAQDQLNTLTQRHLEYYYEKVLQIGRRNPVPDQVHLVFELAKNATEVLLHKGTRLKAGKDETGKPLFYQTTEDTVLNRAAIAHLRTVLYKNGKLHVAPNAGTADGQGEPPTEQPFAWPAMGDLSHPTAPLGFAVAAQILHLSGGTRHIKLLLKLNKPSGILEQAAGAMQVYATGEKGWIGPLKVSSAKTDKPVWEINIEEISASMEALVPYNPEVHEGNFNSRVPMLRILFDPEISAPFLDELGDLDLQTLRIEVEVDGFKNLNLFCTEGFLDGKSTFSPFGGNQPDVGSQFFIDSKEVFSKPLQQINLNLIWQNRPAPSGSAALKGEVTIDLDGQIKVNTDSRYSADLKVLSGNLKGSYVPAPLFQPDPGSQNNLAQTITIPPTPQFKVAALPYYRVDAPLVSAPKKYYATAVSSGHLATKSAKAAGNDPLVYHTIATGIEFRLTEKLPFEGIQLTLRIKNRTDADKNFKPKLSDFSLSYKAATAEEQLSDNTDALTNFSKRTVQFFQIDVFGQREAHGFLQQQNALQQQSIQLVPVPKQEGHLFIGLQNLRPRQSLNLFFQVLEGSANPEKPVEKLNWSVLAGNNWQRINERDLLFDRTNGLLRSNLLRLIVPADATTDNTLLDPGFIWLRATARKNSDAICQLIGAFAQGVTTTFEDAGNHPQHLNAPLAPETISKLAIQIAQVKKISQPYPSFGGRPFEPDQLFYIRVSERLRHKQRAVSIWDYERLVLEKFPEVFQVKCISHCSPDSEVAPGHITLVVIPDYRNYTAGNPLEPRLPLDLLYKIQQWVDGFRMPGVSGIHVQNPLYEKILLDFKVAFRKETNLEFGINRQQLNSDINRLLSPWAQTSGDPIHFDGHYFRSALIYALEKLDYVDFISHFNLYRVQADGLRSEPLEAATATRARAILVPSSEHQINNAET